MAEQNSIKINQFRGIDVSVPEDRVELYRATDALNMIPDAAGQIRKRPGVQQIKNLNGAEIIEIAEGFCLVERSPMNSQYFVSHMADKTDDGESQTIYTKLFSCAKKPTLARYGEKVLVFAQQIDYSAGPLSPAVPAHAGNVQGETFSALVAVLTAKETMIYTDSGNRYRYTEGWEKEKITAEDPLLTMPTAFIGCAYSGGGTPHEVINLLNPWVVEQFCVKSDGERVFHLNDQAVKFEADEEDVVRGADLAEYFKIEILKSVEKTDEGQTITAPEWIERPFTESDAYRKSTNWLFLSEAVGAALIDGEDNLRIIHKRAGFREGFIALCKATCATTYGVAGFKDRLFLGGGKLKNCIYYSELEDPLYIGDLNFIKLEQDAQVEALSGVADNLVAITQDGIYFAAGQVSNGEGNLYATDALFTVSDRIPAPAPIAGGGTAILGGEIVYLSKEGVIAVTSKDQYSERYAEHRSATIDKKMLADGPRFMVSYGRFLLICCGSGICWLLDENQPNTEGDKPYAAHQYEGYRMDGFEASFAYCDSADQLILTRSGGLYKWTEGTEAAHFKDTTGDGARAICAYWETPWITGTKFYLRKNFRRLGILLDLLKGVDTAIRVEGKKNAEDWKLLLDYDNAFCTFSYNDIDYRFFTYNGTPKNPDIKKKIRIKKATRFKLRFTNDIINQTLILNQCGLDYVQEE